MRRCAECTSATPRALTDEFFAGFGDDDDDDEMAAGVTTCKASDATSGVESEGYASDEDSTVEACVPAYLLAAAAGGETQRIAHGEFRSRDQVFVVDWVANGFGMTDVAGRRLGACVGGLISLDDLIALDY